MTRTFYSNFFIASFRINFGSLGGSVMDKDFEAHEETVEEK